LEGIEGCTTPIFFICRSHLLFSTSVYWWTTKKD